MLSHVQNLPHVKNNVRNNIKRQLANWPPLGCFEIDLFNQ